MHPDFPIVSGTCQLTATWSVTLPIEFSRRVEDGELILWRPGITIYFAAWSNDQSQSLDARLTQLKANISPDAFDHEEDRTEHLSTLSYRLIVNGVHELYGFVIAADGHLQVAVYFDNESDIQLARSILSSVKHNSA